MQQLDPVNYEQAEMLIARLNVLFQKQEGLKLDINKAIDQNRQTALGERLTVAQREFRTCWQCLNNIGYYPIVAEGGGFRLSR